MRKFEIGEKVKTDHGTGTVACFEEITYTSPKWDNCIRVGIVLDNPELWSCSQMAQFYYEQVDYLDKLNK